jgi:hypothetical protein
MNLTDFALKSLFRTMHFRETMRFALLISKHPNIIQIKKITFYIFQVSMNPIPIQAQQVGESHLITFTASNSR